MVFEPTLLKSEDSESALGVEDIDVKAWPFQDDCNDWDSPLKYSE